MVAFDITVLNTTEIDKRSSVMSQESKIFQGPVQNWEPTPEDNRPVERLLASDNELDKAYGEAYQAGCFVTEFGGVDKDEAHGMTAVGEMDVLAVAEFRLGKEMNPRDLGLGDCINLGAHPGMGTTRAARVRNGLEQILKARAEKHGPDELDLFGSFTENGYKVDAFMPRNSGQKRQWTVKVYKEGEEDPSRVITIPMSHEPIFGVDIEDRAILEARVDEIMTELATQAR
jgi:hypothetical protein